MLRRERELCVSGKTCSHLLSWPRRKRGTTACAWSERVASRLPLPRLLVRVVAFRCDTHARSATGLCPALGRARLRRRCTPAIVASFVQCESSDCSNSKTLERRQRTRESRGFFSRGCADDWGVTRGRFNLTQRGSRCGGLSGFPRGANSELQPNGYLFRASGAVPTGAIHGRSTGRGSRRPA
jgi:hypothetical protein